MPKEEPNQTNNDEIVSSKTENIFLSDENISLTTEQTNEEENEERKIDDLDEIYVENVNHILTQFEQYANLNSTNIGKYISYQSLYEFINSESN
jgi:hypothetical protein